MPLALPDLSGRGFGGGLRTACALQPPEKKGRLASCKSVISCVSLLGRSAETPPPLLSQVDTM